MIASKLPFSAARALRLAAFSLLAVALAHPAGAQLTRVPNTTLAMPTTAPSNGYSLVTAFTTSGGSAITFNQPVKIVTPPGETNRVFVVSKAGTITVIPDLTNPVASTFLTLTVQTGSECGLLGLAFHPQFATNGFFYVTYSTTGTLRQRLSRFTVSSTNPNLADTASERILIEQLDEAQNHNGGDISFGPDGYLYYSIGDEGGGGDQFNNSQRIDKDFFSGMVRIDVDRKASNLEPNAHASVVLVGGVAGYKVPADNPWVGATSFNGAAVSPTAVRTEWFAVGLRNPWRFSFDSATGRIYCADVGQDAYEEVDLIQKGKNYGWNWIEGLGHPYRSGTPPAAAVFENPLIEYSHSSGDGYSITGGVVYRGTAIAALYGQYIFADYGSSRIWALQLDPNTGRNVGDKVLLVTGTNPVGFGADPRNGDVLVCNIGDGTIKRLVVSNPSNQPPATLSATGAFSSLATLTPNAGIVAYAPNVPFWSDYAEKQRWFSIPNTANTMTFNETGNWTFPAGTVWVKHFDLDLNRSGTGAPNKKRVETRFIVRATAGGVYGVTYKWRDDQSDADLVPEAGDTKAFTVTEAGGATRTQTWIYPGRASCLNCHTPVAGYALSFNTPQLNRTNVFGSQTQNQIEALHGAGYLAAPGSPAAAGYARYAQASDATASLEWRVRSYLAVNCVSCHQPGGPAQGNWDARTILRTAQAGIIDGALVNQLNDAANRVIVRGDTAHSMVHRRVSAAIGSGIHMPPIATNEVNQEAVNLLAAWINGPATSYQTFPEWQQAKFGSTTAPNALATADPDGDGSTNRFEYLLGTNPLSASEAWSYHAEDRAHGQIAVVFPRVANRRYRAFSSLDGQTWTLWNVPANVPTFSATSFTDEISGPKDTGGKLFLRLEVDEP